VISGLRDPLAPDPQGLLRSAGLDPRQAEFHWSAYYALDDAILVQRAVALLKPPAGVGLSVSDGILHAQGIAPDDWLATFPARAAMIPGIRDVEASNLIGATEAEFQRLVGVIQSAVITFPVGSDEVSPAQSASLRLLAPGS
jgi:OOP family OmpA-OmpF porin